jgi:hypothetical protein
MIEPTRASTGVDTCMRRLVGPFSVSPKPECSTTVPTLTPSGLVAGGMTGVLASAPMKRIRLKS